MNLRNAADILAEARQAGETITGPRVGEDNHILDLDGTLFVVGDEVEDDEVIGYTWAVYASKDDMAEMDYTEHDGGTTEAELVAAIERARA